MPLTCCTHAVQARWPQQDTELLPTLANLVARSSSHHCFRQNNAMAPICTAACLNMDTACWPNGIICRSAICPVAVNQAPQHMAGRECMQSIVLTSCKARRQSARAVKRCSAAMHSSVVGLGALTSLRLAVCRTVGLLVTIARLEEAPLMQ